jgi:hypothetical protein
MLTDVGRENARRGAARTFSLAAIVAAMDILRSQP